MVMRVTLPTAIRFELRSLCPSFVAIDVRTQLCGNQLLSKSASFSAPCLEQVGTGGS